MIYTREKGELDKQSGCSVLTLRVHVLGQFEGVRVGQVGVGGGDGQDQTALPGDELHDHVSDLLLDVCGLVAHRNLGDARQVDESQVEHCNSGRGGRVRGSQPAGGPEPGSFHPDFSAGVIYL